MKERAIYGPLGRNVRRARLEAGFSQKRVADAVGMSRAAIATIEAGKQRIWVDTLAKLAHVLRVPVSDFFDEAPKPAPGGLTIKQQLADKLGCTPKKAQEILDQINRPFVK